MQFIIDNINKYSSKWSSIISSKGLNSLPKWLNKKNIIENDIFISKPNDYIVNASKYLYNGLYYLFDTAFQPKQITKQVILIVCFQSLLLIIFGLSTTITSSLNKLTSIGRKKRQLENKMKNCNSYEEWKIAAEDYDTLTKSDIWRQDHFSPLYDSFQLRKRMKDIRDMIHQKDVFNLIFRLRGGLARDQFGMQHEGLFSKAKAGTKQIVEEYHDTVCEALNFICDEDGSGGENIPLDAKLAFFNETRHSFGRTALLLSGGASLGYYHCGLIKCLHLQGLLPRVISGSSAGSLITAMMGTRTDEELIHLINTGDFRKDFISFAWNKNLNKEKVKGKRVLFQYFVPQSFRWLTDTLLKALFEKENVLKPDTGHLREIIIQNVGLHTFQEAFDRTGRIINITVAPLNSYDPPRLMNYLTTPHVTVWSATAASCSIPGIFDSVSLTVKEPNGDFTEEHEWTRLGNNNPFKQTSSLNEENNNNNNNNNNNLNSSTHKYSDGSVVNDLPMQQLSELFNVNHFIVSQVNPHSFLLSSLSLHSTIWSSPLFRLASGYLRFLKHQSRNWLRNVIDLLTFRTVAPSWAGRRGFTQLLTQEYEGRNTDVSIMPWKGHISVFQAFLNLLRNPTDEEFFEIVEVGEKSVWPQLSRIKAHCAVELTLDRCVQRLKSQQIEIFSSGIFKETGSAASSPRRRKKIIDRTPSFFTCHSALNLSKLVPVDQSIIDPIIITQTDINSPDFNIVSEEQEEENTRSYVGFNFNNFENENIDASKIMKQKEEENKILIIDENVIVKPTLSIITPENKLVRSRSMADFYYQKSKNNESTGSLT